MLDSGICLFLAALTFGHSTAIPIQNGASDRLLEDFDIELEGADVDIASEKSLAFLVRFTSWLDVSVVWFVDRDIPVIVGDKKFIVFNTVVKPSYFTKLVIIEDHNIIKTKDIRLYLSANDKSVDIRLNTSNIHSLQSQTFSRMKYNQGVEDKGDKIKYGKPLFDIRSNVEADFLQFYTLTYFIKGWGGGEVYALSKQITYEEGTEIHTIEPKNDTTALFSFLKVGYSSGLVGSLVIGSEINAAPGSTSLPDGNFVFQKEKIYYRKVNTGTENEGDLYRCSAIGNVKLQIEVDNDGTFTNGTAFPHVYINNGLQHELYVVRRPRESCTPALFCQAFYSYKGSEDRSTVKQLPPRYKPWYPLIDNDNW